MESEAKRERLRRRLMTLGALIIVVVIIWIDIATGIWQELVIMAGLAAGTVTFLLTVVVLNRMLAKSTERRWAPVNRLALNDILHSLADDDHSEISRGLVVARTLPMPAYVSTDGSSGESMSELSILRSMVVEERSRLAEALSRWAEFLASSGDYELILRHVADIALKLDEVRDATLELEKDPADSRAQSALEDLVTECNQLFVSLVAEMQKRIADTGK